MNDWLVWVVDFGISWVFLLVVFLTMESTISRSLCGVAFLRKRSLSVETKPFCKKLRQNGRFFFCFWGALFRSFILLRPLQRKKGLWFHWRWSFMRNCYSQVQKKWASDHRGSPRAHYTSIFCITLLDGSCVFFFDHYGFPLFPGCTCSNLYFVGSYKPGRFCRSLGMSRGTRSLVFLQMPSQRWGALVRFLCGCIKPQKGHPENMSFNMYLQDGVPFSSFFLWGCKKPQKGPSKTCLSTCGFEMGCPFQLSLGI